MMADKFKDEESENGEPIDSEDKMPSWMRMDKGGVFNYVIADVNGAPFAIDDNYFKTDILPINFLRFAERQESGLYMLKNQMRTRYGRETIDHSFIPVYLAGMLGLEEKINPEKAVYMLIKRSESGIPRFVADEDGRNTELNFSLALVANDSPGYMGFSREDIEKTFSGIVPAVIKHDRELIPVIDIKKSLIEFTGTFCSLYPELSSYYPFSGDFKYKKG